MRYSGLLYGIKLSEMKRLISVYLLVLLSGCSVKHYEKKFYQKGGKFECEPRIISRVDTLITASGDTIFNTVYKTVYEPKIEYRTKWQVRFDNKRFKDSLDFIKLMYKDSLKYTFKSQKSADKKEIKKSKYTEHTNRVKTRKENKNDWWYWLILGMPLGVLIYKGLGILLKRT